MGAGVRARRQKSRMVRQSLQKSRKEGRKAIRGDDFPSMATEETRGGFHELTTEEGENVPFAKKKVRGLPD